MEVLIIVIVVVVVLLLIAGGLSARFQIRSGSHATRIDDCCASQSAAGTRRRTGQREVRVARGGGRSSISAISLPGTC